MSATTTSGAINRRGAPAATAGAVGRGPWRAPRRGRRLPYLAVGGLLVVVCVLSYAYLAVRLGDRVPVLAVARPVAAGQVFTAADLTQLPAADDPATGLIPASQASQVVGRTAVVPLLAGTLLTRSLVGDAAYPPAGQVVASLALKPGQYPQGLAVGAHVSVFVTVPPNSAPSSAPSSTAPATAPDQLGAVVVGVDLGGDGQGNTVVTLLLAGTDAGRLAGAGSTNVVLMQTSPAGT
jgi:hypothetical protein